jgi:TonB family protein
MQKLNMLCCVVALTVVGVCSGVAQQPNQAVPVDSAKAEEGVDVLSDTQGVNFQPYLKSILRDIYAKWIPLMPAEARRPPSQGTTSIRFTINPDGTIAVMHLDDSAHNDFLDRAAWGSITDVGKFPPLPQDFHGPDLVLRIHFKVNQQPQ